MELRNRETSSTNEKDMMSIQDKTEWCINMINSSSNSDPAKILLLLGRPGVGKSSFLENVTGASGHAGDGTDPVTKTFQIEAVRVDQTLLFVMDTPGINTNAEEAALTEIARGIRSIGSKARIVGVLYVSRIIDRNEDIDNKLRSFLISFCGSTFMPQVTFVTTYWTAGAEVQQRAFNRNLEELKGRNQRDFVDKGAKFYEHGREFINGGGSSGFLDWWSDKKDIADHAKRMICSWYGEENEAESPHFVQQLESGVAVLQTDAARSLGVSFDGPKSTSAPGQGKDTLNADQKPRETSGPRPSMDTSASTNTTQEEEEKEGEKDGGRHTQEQNEFSFWQKTWNWFASLRPTINMTNDRISITLSTSNQDENIQGTYQHSFRPRHTPRTWPAKLDRNSPADNMEARGFNRSLGSRIQMAKEWGVSLPGTPGDIQWGTAYLHELNKRYPW